MQTIQPGALITFGWETFKKRPWFFVGITVLIAVVSGIASSLSNGLEDSQGAATFLALIGLFIGFVLQVFIKMGSINIALKAHDNPMETALEDLWAPENFWNYFIASIVVGLMVVAGFILLIVPGIYLALRFIFVPYLVIDRKLGVSAALRESSRMTEGCKWQLLLFVLLMILLNIAGAILLLVGLLVTIPVTMLALAHAYRTLEHRVNEVVAL